MCNRLLQMLIDAANGVIYRMSTNLPFKAPGILPFASEAICWKQQDGENVRDSHDIPASGKLSPYPDDRHFRYSRLNRKRVVCELPADSLSATASGGCFNSCISLVVPSSWAAD